MTSKDTIRQWLQQGIDENQTHVIVVCDTFDYEDYPVYVDETEDVREVEKKYNGQNMQRIMEVYNLKMNIEDQLNQYRAFNY